LKVRHTNEEIFALLDGLYSLSSIKAYTKGVKTLARDVESDGQMISDNGTLQVASADDIRQCNALKAKLSQHGVTIEDMLGAITETQKAAVPIPEMVSTLKELREASISVSELVRLKEMRQLAKHLGITTQMLEKVLNAASKSGGLENVIIMIEKLNELAISHGDPVELVNSAIQYGKLSKLQADVESLSKKRSGLQLEISDLRLTVESLSKQSQALTAQIESTLKELPLKLKETVAQSQQAISRTTDEELEKMKQTIAEFGEVQRKAGVLENELELARTIQALSTYSGEIPNLSVDYARLFLELAAKVFHALKINLKLFDTDKAGIVETLHMWIKEIDNRTALER
jgi:hypothetical protein